jgi:hypothetical protein
VARVIVGDIILSHTMVSPWRMMIADGAIVCTGRDRFTIEIVQALGGRRFAVTYVQDESVFGALSEPYQRTEHRGRAEVEIWTERVIGHRINCYAGGAT